MVLFFFLSITLYYNSLPAYILEGQSITLIRLPSALLGRFFPNLALTAPMFPWGRVSLPQVTVKRHGLSWPGHAVNLNSVKKQLDSLIIKLYFFWSPFNLHSFNEFKNLNTLIIMTEVKVKNAFFLSLQWFWPFSKPNVLSMERI